MTDLLKDLQGQKFRTICADPPWDHYGFRDPRGRSGKHGPSNHSLPYSVMTLAEIEALPVAGCADKDAVLYLWTTSRFLEAAHGVARRWGFKPGTVLVWCKPPNQGLFGGTFLSNVEFVVTAKRGNPKATGKAGGRWFTWPRRKHSEKPHEFQTMVEVVCPGPRLELFARRARPGWVTIGNEADGMDVKDSLILLAQGKYPCYGVEKHGESRHEQDV
jgi:N6-adenosine-specific RNA methylase IME4